MKLKPKPASLQIALVVSASDLASQIRSSASAEEQFRMGDHVFYNSLGGANSDFHQGDTVPWWDGHGMPIPPVC